MKVVVILLTLGTIVCTAPQAKKPFHEHYEDFIGIILADSGPKIEQLLEQYAEKEDFWFTIAYCRTEHFKNIFQEIILLPEFQAMVECLEKVKIDISYFLVSINELLDSNEFTYNNTNRPESTRNMSKNELSSFIRETIKLFPKQKLAELYDKKKQESDDFRIAMEKLESVEWDRLYSALWENESFKRAVEILADKGIDIHLVVEEVKATFGQK